MGIKMTDKKPSFMDAIKAAQAAKGKSNVPQSTSAKVQQAKFKNQAGNRPTKRTGARS
jgi:hypothetical protein